MMRFIPLLTKFRIAGGLLIMAGLTGFLTVADELRHKGELIGVSAVLVSGIVLVLADQKLKIFKGLPIQWISVCLLASLPLGAYLFDNMIFGISIGFILGLFLAFVFWSRKKVQTP